MSIEIDTQSQQNVFKIVTMKTEPQKLFQSVLETEGLKFTKQRKEVLDYLLNAKKHVTPEEIYRDLNKKDSSLGRATVFRTLHLLEDKGLADTIHFADGRKAYEHKFSRPHHDHMICVDCSNVIEFTNGTIERLQNEITRQYEFTPLWHRHEIFGRCKKCIKKK